MHAPQLGGNDVNFLLRLLGRQSPEVIQVMKELDESSEELRRKLDEDPCASDPTRKECGPDIHEVLMGRHRGRGPWTT